MAVADAFGIIHGWEPFLMATQALLPPLRLPSPPDQYASDWANQYTRVLEKENQYLRNLIQQMQSSVLPTYTTAGKTAIANPMAGQMVFDTTLGKACVYTGSAWETITST